MAYQIKICLLGGKCKECKHYRADPERYGEPSCYLNEDLKGKERYDYLKQLEEHFNKKEEK